jgi:hypothetical protein
VINLVLLADVGDIIQRQIQNDDLDKARECCGDDLRQKHRPGRYLHVMSKLQVRDKAKGLRPAVDVELAIERFVLFQGLPTS